MASALITPLADFPMAKSRTRLPRPDADEAVNWAFSLTVEEAKSVERVALELRLSVTSLLRVLCVEAGGNPRLAALKRVADKLAEGVPGAMPKPLGRPKPKK